MRVLVIGAGGVGTAAVRTAAKWGLFERVVVADHALPRAQAAVAGAGDRFAAYKLDAGKESEIVELLQAERITTVLDSVGPDEWQRPGRRSNGSAFTVDTLARYLLHDVVHHVHDVAGT